MRVLSGRNIRACACVVTSSHHDAKMHHAYNHRPACRSAPRRNIHRRAHGAQHGPDRGRADTTRTVAVRGHGLNDLGPSAAQGRNDRLAPDPVATARDVRGRARSRRRVMTTISFWPDPVVHLLDGNVLYAQIGQAHVHHASAQQWFADQAGAFATCPITQGSLLRLAMRLGGCGIGQALAVLKAVTAHPKHCFWPDELPCQTVRWAGVTVHRQLTDAYLAALARHHSGKLASFDAGLVAMHPDVGVALSARA